MKAQIKKEVDDGFGVLVTDSKGEEHKIGICHDGSIDGHVSDAYPDKAANRTPEENEVNEQARRFAQYYVYCERGYDTVPPLIHPERLNAVRLAALDMDESTLEAHFGDFYAQLRSHFADDADSVVQAPAAAKSADLVVYRQNVYLGLNPLETDYAEEASELADRYGLELSDRMLEAVPVRHHSADELDGWLAYGEDLLTRAIDEDVDLSEGLYVDATGELHMAYLDARGEEHVTNAVEPVDREPDARVEFTPTEPGSLEQFQNAVAYHLGCQIRDCYVRMGVRPPEPFQILGVGRMEATERYEYLDMYPEYHNPNLESEGLFSKLTSFV